MAGAGGSCGNRTVFRIENAQCVNTTLQPWQEAWCCRKSPEWSIKGAGLLQTTNELGGLGPVKASLNNNCIILKMRLASDHLCSFPVLWLQLLIYQNGQHVDHSMVDLCSFFDVSLPPRFPGLWFQSISSHWFSSSPIFLCYTINYTFSSFNSLLRDYPIKSHSSILPRTCFIDFALP